MEQIDRHEVERARKALDAFMKASKDCGEDADALHKQAVKVFSEELKGAPAGLLKRACEAYNSNKSLYKFSSGFGKDADKDFSLLNPDKVEKAVLGLHKTESVKAAVAPYFKPRFYKQANSPMSKTASAKKVAAAPEPCNPADYIELSSNPLMLEIDAVNVLDHQRDLIQKLAFGVEDAKTALCTALDPIERELGHLSKTASREVAEMAASYYGAYFDGIKDMFPPVGNLRKYASAPKLPDTPIFQKIANYMEKAVILELRKDLFKTASADIVDCLKKLAGAYNLRKLKLRKEAGGITTTAVLAPAVIDAFKLADGDKAAVYDKILNNNVRNMLRELEVRRNFYEVYADDYISTFPVDDVRTAYNVAIQKLPERMRRHPSSATQLVRGWVTKMLSRGNVTSAEDAEDVMNAAVNLRNEGFELNPYRESSK